MVGFIRDRPVVVGLQHNKAKTNKGELTKANMVCTMAKLERKRNGCFLLQLPLGTW